MAKQLTRRRKQLSIKRRINNRDGQTNTQKKHLHKTQNHTHGRQRKCGGFIMNANRNFLKVKKESTNNIQDLIKKLNIYLDNRHKLILFDNTDPVTAIKNSGKFNLNKGVKVDLTVPSKYKSLASSMQATGLYLFRGYAFYEKIQPAHKFCLPNCYVLIKKEDFAAQQPCLFSIISANTVDINEDNTKITIINNTNQQQHNIDNPKVLDDAPPGTEIVVNNPEQEIPVIESSYFNKIYFDEAYCFEAYKISPKLQKLHDTKIELKTNILNFHNEDGITRGVMSAMGALGSGVAKGINLPIETFGRALHRGYQASNRGYQAANQAVKQAANQATNAKTSTTKKEKTAANFAAGATALAAGVTGAVTGVAAGAIGATAGALEGAAKGTKRIFDIHGQSRTDAPINKFNTWKKNTYTK